MTYVEKSQSQSREWIMKNAGFYQVQTEIDRLKHLVEQQQSEIQSLRNVLCGLPNHVYWKNKEGIYMGMNQATFEVMKDYGISKFSEFVGKKDNDIYFSESANKYKENDLRVITERAFIVTEELLISPRGDKIPQLSMKKPIYNEDGRITGVLGNTVTINLTNVKNLENQLSRFITFPENENIINKLKFFMTFSFLISSETSGPQWSNPLTLQEKKLSYYLLKGMTSKEIGRTLSLSYRTIERHMENMKTKLHCDSKSQLVNKLFSLLGQNLHPGTS